MILRNSRILFAILYSQLEKPKQIKINYLNIITLLIILHML